MGEQSVEMKLAGLVPVVVELVVLVVLAFVEVIDVPQGRA